MTRRIAFGRGEVIFKEGEPGDTAYVITEGKVDIRIGMNTSAPRTLASCGKGEIVGELALVDGEPHLGTAVAVENTTVLAMSWADFDNRVNAMDPIMRSIVRLMVSRLRGTVQQLQLKPQTAEVNWSQWQKDKKTPRVSN